jgi:hypothetical protein
VDQLDLFAGDGLPPRTAEVPWPQPPLLPPLPETLSDAALIAAIPETTRSTCHGLTQEVARRRLVAAVPALEALCRKFKGFGLQHVIPEQLEALRALAAIGGQEAVAAVRRTLTDDVVAGPGLCEAVQAAASLRCIVPEHIAAVLLRHAEPGVRAVACRCVPGTTSVVALLVSLLEDLNPRVAREAAMALGRRGYPESRPLLLRLLRQDPDSDLVDSVAWVADEESTVLLGRIGRQHPGLRQAVMAALEVIETPRATVLLETLAKRDESHAAG